MPFRLDHNVPPDNSNTAFRVDVKALCAQMVHQFAIFGATAMTSFDPKVESSLPLWPLAMLTFEYSISSSSGQFWPRVPYASPLYAWDSRAEFKS